MRATTIKSFLSNGKAIAVAALFVTAGNLEAATRFRGIEGGPAENEWIPRLIGRFIEAAGTFISGVIGLPPG